MVDPAIIAKVRKLLSRTSENGCTPHEAESAFALATRLMAEHTISMDEIREGGEIEGCYSEETVATSRRSRYEYDLAACICRDHFFVQIYKTWGGDEGYDESLKQMLFGTPTHIEAAKWVFHALIAAFDRLWDEYRGVHPDAARRDRKTFIVGVYHGFHSKLGRERRAVSAEQEEVARIEREALRLPSPAGKGGALALFEGRLLGAFQEAHPDLVSGRSVGTGSGSGGALAAGRSAGSKLTLSRPVTCSRVRQGLPHK